MRFSNVTMTCLRCCEVSRLSEGAARGCVVNGFVRPCCSLAATGARPRDRGNGSVYAEGQFWPGRPPCFDSPLVCVCVCVPCGRSPSHARCLLHRRDRPRPVEDRGCGFV